MSKGLGKIERRVLDICMGCFRLRKKIIEEAKPKEFLGEMSEPINCHFYSGGARLYSYGEYRRVVSIGRDREKFSPPEDIIDLREVVHFYRERYSPLNSIFGNLVMGSSKQVSFNRAVRSLLRKDYLARAGDYDYGERLRFIRLGVKCFERRDNT
jgi:hypothetical protein